MSRRFALKVTMYDLPSLDGVEEVVISEEVVNGKDARPLYIYAERKKDELSSSAQTSSPSRRRRWFSDVSLSGRCALKGHDRNARLPERCAGSGG